MSSLSFPKFEDIPVSTKTIIAMTNMEVNIDKAFAMLPVTPYYLPPTKRGKKNVDSGEEIKQPQNQHLRKGDIVSLKYCGKLRGTDLKKPPKVVKKSYFRNSLSIVMIVEDAVSPSGDTASSTPPKQINFKLSKNGKFQLTGCKTDEHAEICVKEMWKILKRMELLAEDISEETSSANSSPLFSPQGEHLSFILIPAMRNIDFNLGFLTNRDELHKYFLDSSNNECSQYISHLETSIGYTGINIKIPSRIPIATLKLKKITSINNRDVIEYVPYQEYLNTMDVKEQKRKLEKERYNTFLIFQSGKTIMTSMCAEFAKDMYNDFIRIIANNAEKFREKLDSSDKKLDSSDKPELETIDGDETE